MNLFFNLKKYLINGTIDTKIKIVPNTATIDDPAGKSKWKDTFNPIKLPIKLTHIAIITTTLFVCASIIAQTDGIIR